MAAKKLFEARHDVAHHLEIDNTEELKSTLSNKYPEVEIKWAVDDSDAVTYIDQIAEGTSTVSINNSSIVNQELTPKLVAAGQLSSGMSDWIGREKIVTIASILSISGLIALILVKDTSQPWLLYLYAVCFGYGAGLSSPTIYAGMADIFHGKYFGSIGGLMLTGFAIAGVIGPWLGGYIYDISGSYISPFLFSMVCLGLSSVLFWIAGPRKTARL